MSNEASSKAWKMVLARQKTILQYQLFVTEKFAQLFNDGGPTDDDLNQFAAEIEGFSKSATQAMQSKPTAPPIPSAPSAPSAPSTKPKATRVKKEKEVKKEEVKKEKEDTTDKVKGKQRAGKSKPKAPVETVDQKSGPATSEDDMSKAPPPGKGKVSKPSLTLVVKNPVETTGIEIRKGKGKVVRNISAPAVESGDDADEDTGAVHSVIPTPKVRAGKRKASNPAVGEPGPLTETSASSTGQRTVKRPRITQSHIFTPTASDENLGRMFEHRIYKERFDDVGMGISPNAPQGLKEITYNFFYKAWMTEMAAGVTVKTPPADESGESDESDSKEEGSAKEAAAVIVDDQDDSDSDQDETMREQ